MTEEICLHCREPIKPYERRSPMLQPFHLACGLRMIIGGYNHICGRCSCCGGTEDPDPPGLSKREAARLAVDEWRRREDGPDCEDGPEFDGWEERSGEA